jgi:hypothetical protein
MHIDDPAEIIPIISIEMMGDGIPIHSRGKTDHELAERVRLKINPYTLPTMSASVRDLVIEEQNRAYKKGIGAKKTRNHTCAYRILTPETNAENNIPTNNDVLVA